MNKLAFFMTAKACYGVISTPTRRVESVHEIGARAQSEVLVPFLENLIKKSDIQKDDITTIIAPKGPGSFTTLRVLLATAQGISIAYPRANCYAPTLFDAMLYTLRDNCYAVIDSKRGDYFVQKKNTALQMSEPLILTEQAFQEFKQEHAQWSMVLEPDVLIDNSKDSKIIETNPMRLLDALLDADLYTEKGSFEPFYLFDPVFKKSAKALF
jgi:tRNA A37 threonylcarbamoyladenosine modification protein TsaB